MVSYAFPFSFYRQTIVFQRVYVTFMMTVCFLIDIQYLLKVFLFHHVVKPVNWLKRRIGDEVLNNIPLMLYIM